MKLER